jgi:hypothetical protein
MVEGDTLEKTLKLTILMGKSFMVRVEPNKKLSMSRPMSQVKI